MHKTILTTFAINALALATLLAQGIAHSSQQPAAPKTRKLGDYIIVTVAEGLDRPWGLALLPDGTMLVTELPGRLRVIRQGVLDPKPVAGLPAIWHEPFAGLMDVVLHPDFARNRFVYLSYIKQGPRVAPGKHLMAEKLILPNYYNWKPPGDAPDTSSADRHGRSQPFRPYAMTYLVVGRSEPIVARIRAHNAAPNA